MLLGHQVISLNLRHLYSSIKFLDIILYLKHVKNFWKENIKQKFSVNRILAIKGRFGYDFVITSTMETTSLFRRVTSLFRFLNDQIQDSMQVPKQLRWDFVPSEYAARSHLPHLQQRLTRYTGVIVYLQLAVLQK